VSERENRWAASGYLTTSARALADRLEGARLIRFFRQVARAYFADDVMGLAAEMAYQFLFALFPFFVFLAALLGFVSAHTGQENLFGVVMRFSAILAPEEIQALVRDWVTTVVYSQSTGLLTFGALGAFVGAGVGIATLVKGLNRAHRVARDRPFWRAQVVFVLGILAYAGVMIAGVTIYTIGDWTVRRLAALGGLDPGFAEVWRLIHGPGVALGLFLVLLVLYSLLPYVWVDRRANAVAALFATVGWLVVTRGFSFYLSHLGIFGPTYGAFAATIILMVWMYAISTILLIGGEISAVLAGHREMRDER
jgi:membrane protein